MRRSTTTRAVPSKRSEYSSVETAAPAKLATGTLDVAAGTSGIWEADATHNLYDVTVELIPR